MSRPDPISQANVVLIPAQTATACLTLAAAAFLGQSEFCISGPTPHKDLIRETLSESGSAGFFQCLSSGSSGRPKRMRRSHASWTKSFRINAGLWGIMRQGPQYRIAILSHSWALYSCLEGLYLGADLLLLSDLRPDRQAIQIEKKDASILYATPTQLRQLHTYAARPLPSLRKVIIGGASMGSVVIREEGYLGKRRFWRSIRGRLARVPFYVATGCRRRCWVNGSLVHPKVFLSYPN